MSIRPPLNANEQAAADLARDFVNDLRALFDNHNILLHSLVAETPTGHILTIGEISKHLEAANVEAISTAQVGPIPRNKRTN